MSDSSCSSTYVTLCIYHEIMHPDEITKTIGLLPTRISIKNLKRIKKNGWFFSTQDKISSTVLSEHLVFLLNVIEPLKANIDELTTLGAGARLFCFWMSAKGNGGPLLDSKILKQLGASGIDLDFDIWFDDR